MELLLTTFLMVALTGGALLAGFLVYDRGDRKRVLAEVDDKKTELMALIAGVQTSHNDLVETHRAIDSKVTELGLRLSQMGAPQATKPRGFPGL